MFDNKSSIEKLGLDNRLLKAMKEAGWKHPTLIQSKALPFILGGRDVMIRSQTGTGKTATYVLPMLQKLLTAKETAGATPGLFGLILVPTRELCRQVEESVLALSA